MPTLTLVTPSPTARRWALDRAGVPYESARRSCYAFVLPRTRGVHRARSRPRRAARQFARSRPPTGACRRAPVSEDAASRARSACPTFDGLGGRRRYAYCHLGAPGTSTAFTPSRVERAHRRSGRRVSALRRAFRPSPRAMDRLEAKLRAIFADVGTRLEGGARPYLVGSRFTAADLGFAAMSGAVLLPEAYGSPFPPLERVPARFRALVEELRDTPAGRYAQATLARHRRERVGDA